MRLAEPSGPLVPGSIALGATERRCLLLSASCTGVRPFQGGALAAPRLQAPKQHLQVCEAASLQFIKGVNESTVPDVSLRRSRTGTSGQAMFTFENPSIFQASSELGDITGRRAPPQHHLLPLEHSHTRLAAMLTLPSAAEPAAFA